MENKKNNLKRTITLQGIENAMSINDLRDKQFKGDKLTIQEKQAIVNFDKFRINELNAQLDDIAFHKRYKELQILANIGEFQEFLKEKYQ